MTKSVCITGYGIIDALGSTPEECYANYMSSNHFASEVDTSTKINKLMLVNTDTSKMALPTNVSVNNLSKTSKMALHAVTHALKMSGVENSSNVGVFFSSSVPLDHLNDFMANHFGLSKKRLGPRKLLDSLTGSLPSLISLTYGFNGINVGVNAACASGIAALDYAMRHIDDYDFLVVGASDSINNITVSIFDTLGALSNDSKPFDRGRNGFLLGEGAGCFIVETEEKARARGAKIIAKLFLPGIATDLESETAPDKEGRGAIAAMSKAILNADRKIDFVNAHATSTLIGDEVEYRAIRSLVDVPIYSCKGRIGHSIIASNINEMIYTILFNQHHHSGFNYNLVSPIDGSYGLPTAPEMINAASVTTLKNSFGFGGRCMSQAIEVMISERI